MHNLHRQAYLQALHKRARAFEKMDPRIAQLLPHLESEHWRVSTVTLPLREDGIGNLTIAVHFRIKIGEDSHWYRWCHRILLAGNAMGVHIYSELRLEDKSLVKDWVISFLYDLDKAEDFEVRLLEALQRFRDILVAAR